MLKRSMLAASVAGLLLGGAGQPEPAPAGPREVKFEDLPAPARLGFRVDAMRRRIGVIPTLVVVPETASYAAAIGAWTVATIAEDRRSIGGRYPVLIDDGTWRAREDIARFVRAFKPRAVVRWSSGDAKWPVKEDEQQKWLESHAYRGWGGETFERVRESWVKAKFAPPGVVVASMGDPAWTAALALSAGHGQPMVWASAKGELSGAMTLAEAGALEAAIEQGCSATGFTWKGIGDEIEAVTLCLSVPASVRLPESDPRKMLATTDLIGRGAEQGTEQRWAWAGQIAGSESRAAYVAMCALFLEPERAWLFDGYANKEPWSKWDASGAAIELERAKIPTVLNDNGNQSADSFRRRAGGLGLAVNDEAGREPAAGVEAGLICVNTSGMPDRFDLLPGGCRMGDVPFLRTPAAVHFVHSWSAARPGDRSTIAGRFLERGAFAYLGSVHEPYLQSFVPTPSMVARLLAMGPWGAAVRLDNAPAWKLAVFGDPIWTIGPAAPRTEAPLPLEGAVDVQAALGETLKGKRYADALGILAMVGRDSDAYRLLLALQNDDPEAITIEAAQAGVMSAFRSPGREGSEGTGERRALLALLCRTLEPRYIQEPELRDIPWHAFWVHGSELTRDQVLVLAGAIRPEQSDRDARELADIALRSLGRDDAMALMNGVRPRLTDPEALKAVDEVLRR